MDFYLSINNREQVIQLPVVPTFTIPSPYNNEKYTTISQGDIKLLGLRGLKEITLKSFFPSKDYPFVRSKDHWGWEYVEIFEKWRERRVPIRLVITNTPINLPMSFDNFDYGIQDGSGDIEYTMKLTEFKFVKLQEKKV